MFTLASILFHREALLVWFPWQPCGGVFNLLQSISSWSFFFFFCCWSHSSGEKKKKNCLFACTRSMWLFILEVILQLKTQAHISTGINPPISKSSAPCASLLSQSGVHTTPTRGLVASRVKATGKSIFHLYFYLCIFGLVKLWKYKAFLGSSNKIMPTELVTSNFSSWGPISSLLL